MKAVCGKCGDRGFPETLVRCFVCQDAFEHRYCFDNASDIFRKDVRWACQDCILSTPKKAYFKPNNSNLPTRRSKRIISRNLQFADASPGSRASNMTTALATKKRKKRCNMGENVKILELPVEVCLSELEGEDCFRPREEKIFTEETKGSLSGAVLWTDLQASQTANDDLAIVPLQSSYIQAQPIEDPIWTGTFSILNDKFTKVDGVVAYLSSNACIKVRDEASSLPSFLYPDILPKSDVWPKCFQEVELTDDCIALYFFPENNRDEEVFSSLVNYMIRNDLSMRCEVENADLLVFTSVVLAPKFRSIQKKDFLWGVFREKQPSPPT